MNFGEFLWYTLVVFAFVVLLMILFSIIGDLFRDHELSGWGKAGWLIFLVIFPWLTALIYLIVRGKGMSERSIKSAQERAKQQQEYIQTVAGSTSPAEQIKHSKELLDSGSITQAEFDQLKAKALAS